MSVKVFASAALLSAMAFASVANANAGKEQIAAQLGVSASEFTLSELMELNDARRDGDVQAWDYVVSGTSRAETSAAFVAPTVRGRDQ